MSKRPGLSRDDFVAAFSGVGVPAHVSTAVYDYYIKSVILRNFRVSPDDKYEDLLKREEEINEDARSLMNTLGLRPPSEEVVDQWMSDVRARRRPPTQAPNFQMTSASWTQPILTIRDMVLWLDLIRRHQSG
jgi:hypothetical protein